MYSSVNYVLAKFLRLKHSRNIHTLVPSKKNTHTHTHMLLFIPFPYNSIQYIAHIQDKHDQLLLVLSVIVVKCCCSSKSKEEEEEVPAGQVVKKTFKKLCVLVVDDDRSCRSLYMGFIQMRGGFPYMAENGEEAVNLYRDGQTFNLILMDNEMPVMDGVSVRTAL